jgi:hypothetical protein
VGTDAVVITRDEPAIGGAVLVVSFGATVTTAVKITVLPDAVITAKLVRRISLDDRDSVGDVKVI